VKKVNRFEDLIAWEKARKLVKAVYDVTSSGPFSQDFDLRRQIRRASVSVMANISEGFEREGDKEFLQFLSLAKGSCGEVRSHLYAAMDLEYLSKEVVDKLSQDSVRTSQVIGGLMRYLKESEFKGSKFR